MGDELLSPDQVRDLLDDPDSGVDINDIDPSTLDRDAFPPIVISSFEQLWHSNAYRACIESFLFPEPESEPTDDEIDASLEQRDQTEALTADELADAGLDNRQES